MYIYCTKGEKILTFEYASVDNTCRVDYPCGYNAVKKLENNGYTKHKGVYNGKVVARFWCDKVEEIYCQLHFNGFALETDTMNRDTLNKKSCLTDKELREYFNRGVYTFDETYGYAIHISKLEVFNKPKELKEFYKVGAWQVCEEQFNSSYLKRAEQEIMEELGQTITKAPQSWCYVEGD